MNVKKAIKRIAALAAGTTMVTATIMGAMAYDLSNYPEPFVKNGVFNGKLVIGRTAYVSDVIGAIDISASLQAAAVTPVDGASSTGVVSVTGGVQIKSSSEDFNFGDSLADFNGNKYDAEDFPSLLADGTVEDDSTGTDYDYEQTINVPNATLSYGQNDDYGDDPVFYLDLAGASPVNMQFNIDFDDTVNVSAFQDSESIDMFGKTYTFDPNNVDSGDLTLYGSDTTVTVTQNEPQTVKMDGKEYKIEVIGGNTGTASAIIRVTSGSSTETKTLTAGDSRKMAGLDLFIDDVFISDIGEDTISVSVFVGSEKIVIPDSAVSATPSYKEVTIGSDDTTKIYAWVKGASLGAVDAIHFQMDPTDFEDSAISDDWNWLPMGEEFVDPLFGFKLDFTGMMPAIDGRTVTELSRQGDAYNLKFTNNDGTDYDLELVYAPTATTLDYGDNGKFLGAGSNNTISEDQKFILESTDAKAGEKTTYVFEVRNTDTDVPEKVTLKELGTGATKDYKLGDEIEDTGVTVDVIGDGWFNMSANPATRIVTKDGMIVDWTPVNSTSLPDSAVAIGSAKALNVTFAEDSEDFDEASASALTVQVTPDPTDDIVLSSPVTNYTEASDTDGNNDYGVSSYGTWFDEERDNRGDYLKVYYSGAETDFNVFLNGPDAVVVTSGASSSDAYVVNDLVVGQIAVYDDEAINMVGNTPLIVVGGPCVNEVAAELMGNPEVCAEGFTEGRAKIKLFADKNAVLVAGYNGEDTTGGAQVLAGYKDYDLTGDEVEVITTDLTELQVVSVQ